MVLPPTAGSDAGTGGVFTAMGGAVGGLASNVPGWGIASARPGYAGTRFGCHGEPTTTGTQVPAAPFKIG